VVESSDCEEFEKQCGELILGGYIPAGPLYVHLTPGHWASATYYQGFYQPLAAMLGDGLTTMVDAVGKAKEKLGEVLEGD
jgi:hypothetical protein